MKKIFLSVFMATGFAISAIAQQGAALHFDGTDDLVVINDSGTNISGNLTLEAWVNLNDVNPGIKSIISTRQLTGDYSTQFRVVDGNKIQVLVGTGSSWLNTGGFVSYAFTAGEWTHLASVLTDTGYTIYVNGVNSGSVSYSGTPVFKGANHPNIYIGGHPGNSEYFSGSMDEVRIWNVARTETQIQDFMNCSVTNAEAGLICAYHFNDGVPDGNNATNTSIFDATWHKLNGTLMNFDLNGNASNFVTENRSNYLAFQGSIAENNTIAETAGENTWYSSISGDFNGDGYPDLLRCQDWTNNQARIYLNDGKGNFSNTADYTFAANIHSPNISTGDIDGDGDIDFVASATNTFTIYINDGTGTAFTTYTTNCQAAGNTAVLKLTDINDDNHLDLIIAKSSTGANDSTEVWLNNSTGADPYFSFSNCLVPASSGQMIGRGSIDVADVNQDGFVDMVLGGSAFPVALHFGNGDGTFTAQGTIPNANYSNYSKFVDWNNDGLPDLISNDIYNGVGIRLWLNDGTGTFQTYNGKIVPIPSGANTSIFENADLNRDGFQDIVYSGGVYLNNGCALTRQLSCDYVLGNSHYSNTIADFNQDGTADIFCNTRQHVSSLWLNFLDPVVAVPIPVVSVTGTTEICIGSTTDLTASGADTYSWNTGDATNVVQLSPTVSTTYTVTGKNAVGCSSDTAFVTITVNDLPTVTFASNPSSATVCAGEDVTLTGNGASSYTWTGGVTDGNAFTPTTTANYTVTGTDTNGCENTAVATVTVNDLPTVTTSVNGLVILANETGLSYQWVDCDNSNAPISGDTAQTFTATANGNYAVVVTDGNSCENTSACVSITTVGITEISNAGLQWIVYPNPAHTVLNISTTSTTTVKIVSVLGAVVYTQQLNAGINSVDVSNLKCGVYFINNDKGGVVKFIKE